MKGVREAMSRCEGNRATHSAQSKAASWMKKVSLMMRRIAKGLLLPDIDSSLMPCGPLMVAASQGHRRMPLFNVPLLNLQARCSLLAGMHLRPSSMYKKGMSHGYERPEE